MERRSKHRIWLKDIRPYVFCDTYKKRHQFRKDGEFEIYFVNEEGLLISRRSHSRVTLPPTGRQYGVPRILTDRSGKCFRGNLQRRFRDRIHRRPLRRRT